MKSGSYSNETSSITFWQGNAAIKDVVRGIALQNVIELVSLTIRARLHYPAYSFHPMACFGGFS